MGIIANRCAMAAIRQATLFRCDTC